MTAYIGIDVQTQRPPCFAVLSPDGELLDAGWAAEASAASVLERLQRWTEPGRELVVGVDAPRSLVPNGRAWAFRRGNWVHRQPTLTAGRHCEVVLRTCGLANPQWTGPEPEPWVQLGIELFQALGEVATVHEVFPSATYVQLAGTTEPALQLSFGEFAPGPKDMLDACMAALTVREYELGRGCSAGGGDGFGAIVLARPCTHRHFATVNVWPELRLDA